MSSEQRNDANYNSSNTSLSLSKLQPFSKYPFKKHSLDKMQELADSIAERGVIVPILVRPIDGDKYEIVSGHNRVEASRLAGKDSIISDVRELDDDTATIIMVDSNLQRETVLPSEKAWAYKYKLDAIKSQGKRSDLTLAQVGLKLGKQHSIEIIAENSDDSRNQIKRYIRLTNLIPQLLDKVDERKLSFIPAVELSYLKKQEQTNLFDILFREEKFGLPLKQATLLKGISKHGKLLYKKIDDIITKGINDKPKNFKVPYKKVNDYFSPDTTPMEFEDTIVKALNMWFEKHPNRL